MGAPGVPGAGDKARFAQREATALLADEEFHDLFKLSHGALERLHEISRGEAGRHSASHVQAARTLLEWGHARPKQVSELHGDVQIVVVSALPGPPGSAYGREPGANALVVAGERKALEGRISPGIGSYVNREAEPQALAALAPKDPFADPAPDADPLVPAVHCEPMRTGPTDQRKDAARAQMRADLAALDGIA